MPQQPTQQLWQVTLILKVRRADIACCFFNENNKFHRQRENQLLRFNEICTKQGREKLKCCGGSFAKYNQRHARFIIYNARAYQCGEEHKTATNLATAPNTPRPNSSAGRTEQVKDLNATTKLLLLARRQDSASVGPSELQKLLTSSAHKCKKNREKYREIAEKVATDSAANSETQHSDTKEMSIRSQVGKKRQRR
jgi:hypothetical protein